MFVERRRLSFDRFNIPTYKSRGGGTEIHIFFLTVGRGGFSLGQFSFGYPIRMRIDDTPTDRWRDIDKSKFIESRQLRVRHACGVVLEFFYSNRNRSRSAFKKKKIQEHRYVYLHNNTTNDHTRCKGVMTLKYFRTVLYIHGLTQHAVRGVVY